MDHIVVSALLKQMVTQNGKSVFDLSVGNEVMLVFLRHFGCFFCREALDEISKLKQVLSTKGVKVVFVHMSENSIADQYFDKYEFQDANHVSDKECYYYSMFKLGKASLKQLFSLQSFIRGFDNVVLKGGGGGLATAATGDEYQMPGIFIIREGKIVNQFIHKVPSDRPNYVNLLNS